MTVIATTDIQDGIASLIIDSPPVNALGHAVRRAIVDNLAELGRRDDVEAIVLRCAGRTFFAGADISEFGKPFETPDLNDVVAALEDCPKIVVCAIHGTALGGGLEVALGAHYRIASSTARLGFPEVNLGLVPGAGGTQRAPRAMEALASLQLITGGKPLSAADALAAGLLDRVVDGDLAAHADAYARALVADRAPRRQLRLEPPKVVDKAALQLALDTARGSKSQAVRGCAQALALAVSAPFEEGLAGERAIFDALAAGAQSRALRHLFFAEREAGKIAGGGGGAGIRAVGSVGIVGAGTMGGGIAMNFLAAGIPVTLVELRQEALDRGVTTIRRNYEATVRKGRLSGEELERRMALLQPSLEFEDLGKVDLVIEAAFESMPVKLDIFAQLQQVARGDAILATNTSFLDVDAIAAATSSPERVLGLHFFSPANIMKLLEIVEGAHTSPEVVASAMALAKRLGKTAVVSRVCHGFIANRIMDVRRVEAEKLLLRGMDPLEIDAALLDYGFPMGQFAMMDLVGLDVMGRDSDERTLMGDFVAAGRLGQKSGAGYYDYDDQRVPATSKRAREIIADFAKHAGEERAPVPCDQVVERLLYPVVNECARLIDEGIVRRASDIDVAVGAGYGWPVETGGPVFWAQERGLSEIVAFLDAHDFDVALELRWAAHENRPLGAKAN